MDECKKEIVPEGLKRCTPYSVVFEEPEIPEKVFLKCHSHLEWEGEQWRVQTKDISLIL